MVARLPIETADMIRLYETGLSAAEVAKELGCHPATVKQRFRREGYKMRPPTERTERWYSNIAKAKAGSVLSRHEARFLELFQEHGLNPLPGFPVGRWQVDLAFPERKVAIEIDTSWHKLRADHDAEKDQALTEMGWVVRRVRVNSRTTGVRLVPRLIRELGLLDS